MKLIPWKDEIIKKTESIFSARRAFEGIVSMPSMVRISQEFMRGEKSSRLILYKRDLDFLPIFSQCSPVAEKVVFGFVKNIKAHIINCKDLTERKRRLFNSNYANFNPFPKAK